MDSIEDRGGAGGAAGRQRRRALQEERAAIWGEAAAARDVSPKAFAERHSPAALCLSGGGIRSAAFSLGVLQGLARRGLLRQFHYLSTVSGGGYMGGWLTRWIRATPDGVQAVEAQLRQSETGDFTESPEIRQLRERSNFLTPRIGVASTDSWTAAAIVIRNLLLTWLVFLPALLLLALVLNVYRDLFWGLRDVATGWWAYLPLILLSCVLAFATMQTARWLPTHAIARRDGSGLPYASAAKIRRWIVTPAVAWAGLLPLALAPAILARDGMAPVVAGFATFLAALAGYVWGWVRARAADREHFRRNLGVWIVASAAAAVLLGLGVRLTLDLVPAVLPLVPIPTELDNRDLLLGLLVALAPLWAIVAHALLSTIYAGFRRIPRRFVSRSGFRNPLSGLRDSTPSACGGQAKAGTPEPRPASELDREWLARLSAAKLQMPVLWTLLGLAGLVLPVLVFRLGGPTIQWIGGMVASVSGVLAVIGGRSALSAVVPGPDAEGRRWRLSFANVVAIAALVFGATLLAVAGWAEQRLAGLGPAEIGTARHLVPAVLLGGLLWVSSRYLQVNRFSLHGLYRNRIVRAFLGAARSRAKRQADPFTDFDGADNIRMQDAWRPPARGDGALFPVVNLALNITGGDRLAWQERKAVSFTVTPLACGWTDPVAEDSPVRRGAYVDTEVYGGNETDLGMQGSGISLGTAMTISGAAASPNMGYSSSAPTAFLLALFNVRLGAWLPNTARPLTLSEMSRSGPRHALLPLLREILGWSDDTAPYVYLSDGGHFDNLGLYEMVRRRCTLILVSDAGQDLQCRFEDLGMAARKIYVDQQVRIEVGKVRIVRREATGKDSLAFAVGRIVYPEGLEGRLVYVKPSYLPDSVPIGVRAYAEAHRDFPHESTADQWFSESQFESYRCLGEALLDTMDPDPAPPASLGDFFRRVEVMVRPFAEEERSDAAEPARDPRLQPDALLPGHPRPAESSQPCAGERAEVQEGTLT